MKEQQEQHHFLLFINTKSGGQKGKQYLTVGEEKLKLKSKQGYYAFVYLYDLFNQTQRESGLKNLQQLTKTKINVNVIICGGDGTVLWVVSSVIKAGVNPNDVSFGIIPIGTGNDFSRSLGWGGSPITFSQNNLRELRKRIVKWVSAQRVKFDLWDISIETYQNGNISNSSSNVHKDKNIQNVTTMFRTFSNYAGIGIDARVSYHFQKRRTPSKLINLMLYGCLGFCCLFKQKHKMEQVVSQFSQSQSETQSGYSSQQGDETSKGHLRHNNLKLIQKNMSTQLSQVKIKKGYTGIVCLNCTSYMSGVKNIFKTRKIGAKNKVHKDFTQQSFNDGKLQFVGFKNQLTLGLQRFINTAAKISQGQGPFTLKFNRSEQKKQIFIQIDGEALLVQNLKQIRITKTKLTASGKINVLINQDN